MTTIPQSLSRLTPQPPDPILSIITKLNTDPRTDKIDLGVGVYRDPSGHTPVMHAVKQAEEHLLRTQTTKTYLGAQGDPGFLEKTGALAFGAYKVEGFGVQTPGGAGALRLAFALAQVINPQARVWLGAPSWPIHDSIIAHARLALSTYPAYYETAGVLDLNATLSAIERASPGDFVLLHACCHNPTGGAFSASDWRQIADTLTRSRAIPVLDAAYQGFGDGLEADTTGVQIIFEACSVAMLAYSCSKNFGLYRERTGALFVQARGAVDLAKSNTLALSRSLWSMPPDHGAAIVRTILESAELTASWRTELEAMRNRIRDMRAVIARTTPSLSAVATQQGMFSQIALLQHQIDALREQHGVYMTDSGRINIAGFRDEAEVKRFAEKLSQTAAS
jgi:aromatic-amino-acid transaminase